MEITDLRVEDYSKVVDLSALLKHELLSEICIIDKKQYSKDIQCFDVATKNGSREQLYISKLIPDKCIEKIIFLSKTPKILFLRGDSFNIVIEKKIHDRLDNYIIFYDSKQTPYLQQGQARKIASDLTESIDDFHHNGIQYNCLSPKNIVRIDEKWYLSSVGAIFNIDENNTEYYNDQFKGEQKLTYSLGCLLFKLIFGFAPFDGSKRTTKPFSFKTHLSYLESLDHLKSLKIYYFVERMLVISESCRNLLEQSLGGKLTLKQWKEHEYFKTQLKPTSPVNEKSKEIQMINEFGLSNCSLILSAIEHRNKYPLEKLNPKTFSYSGQLSYIEIIQSYKKNPILKFINFAPDFEQRQHLNVEEEVQQILPSISIEYFFQENFDPEEDYPCRQLIKFIQQEKQDCPQLYKKGNQREYELKMYGYPYAMAFQLVKVEKNQPLQIKKKIKKTIEYLLDLSALNYPGKIKNLHLTKPKVKKFDEMKSSYREHINQLYRYFLNEAMRKYNSKKQSSLIERAKQKEKGLEYYRLCLKLLQASLIVRKGGRDLDLGRIETSQRKEIENDLSGLLKQYFPNKAQVH